MGAITTAIIVVTTTLIVNALITGARHKGGPNTPESFTVRFHGGVLAIGIICMLLFGGFIGLSFYALLVQGTLSSSEAPLVFGGFSFFFLLGAVLTLAAARFRMNVSLGRIEYTPVLGRTYVLRPTDIAYFVSSPTKLKAYDTNHRALFSVDPSCRGRDLLESWLWRYGVKPGTSASVGQVLAARLRNLGRKSEREYLPPQTKLTRQRQQQWQERQRQYMESPPDLPDNLADLLHPLLRQSIGLIAADPAIHCPLGRSKFGGEPDLPSGFQWDYFTGEAPVFKADASYEMVTMARPLAFLLQINCQELAAVYPQSPLPKLGLLAFFYEMDTMLWGPQRLDKAGYARVHYFPSTDGLVRTQPPDDLDERYHILQHPINLHMQYSLPHFNEFARGRSYTHNFANHKLYDQYRAGLGVEHSGHGELAMDSRLFGWPESIQNDVFDEFDVEYAKAEGTCPPPTPVDADAPPASGDWQLLLQLASSTYDEMGAGSIMFGDYGNLYFGIRTEDLAAGRFDRVWFTLQCT